MSNLAVESGDRSGIDDDATLSLGIGLLLCHCFGSQPDHVERTDQVDVDNAAEAFQSVRAIAPHRLFADGNAGTVYQAVDSAELPCGSLDNGFGMAFAEYIAFDESRLFAAPRRQRLTCILAQICNNDVTTLGDNHFNGCCAKPGSAAGHDECVVSDVHFGRVFL